MTARLVTIGDSLTQGFQHGAIRRSDWSFPAMMARALRIEPFRRPDFSGDGVGGPLLDLELLLRRLSDDCGKELDAWEAPRAIATVVASMGQVEDYWERGPGAGPSHSGPLHHDLASWGFDALDSTTLTDRVCRDNVPPARDNWLRQLPEHGMYRTARRVLNPAQDPAQQLLTQLGAAAQIGQQEGIENLLVWLGGNNALGTCVTLEVRPSEPADLARLAHERNCTLWRAQDFEVAYAKLIDAVQQVKTERVFLATVPHLTIPPVTRGVSPHARAKNLPEREGNYYEYYTRFWTWDDHFSTVFSEKLTRDQAREIDATIDAYNACIRKHATARGYHVIDSCALLDELAFRRNDGKPPYQFPPKLVEALQQNPLTSHRVRPDGTVLLDTRYMRIPAEPPHPGAGSADWQAAYRGGIFSLDGIHPTTTGYGLIAHEVLAAFQRAGVPGADPALLDWPSIVEHDTLLCTPPALLTSLEATLDRALAPLQQLFRLFERMAG
jgi:hypothetical protein